MRRVVCRAFGPVEALEIEELPDPQPGPGQVRVATRAAGLNFVDGLIVEGRYQIKPPLPFVPGGEVAGVVDAVGEGVTRWSVGDRVVVTTMVGGFADQVIVAADRALAIPDGITDGQAATMIQNYATNLFAFTRRTTIEPGETVLVLGAGGGIGLAAVDVASSLGATVIGAASSADKRAVATAAGAAATIDYTTEDLKARARELGGGGVDVVVDPVGGPLAESALRALRPEGRYLVLGFASGEIPRLPANHVLLTNRAVIGVDLGAWVFRNPAANDVLLAELFHLFEEGSLTPPEPATYPLDQVAVALRDLLERRAVGKLALVP